MPAARRAATSATVTCSSTARRLARTATHTSRNRSALPWYVISSERTPRTFASGPSTARITSASVISSAGPREPVAAVGTALAGDETRVPEVDQDVLEEVERDLLRLREPVALHRAGAGRGELDGRADRVVRLGGDPHRVPVELVEQDADLAHLAEPETTRGSAATSGSPA